MPDLNVRYEAIKDCTTDIIPKELMNPSLYTNNPTNIAMHQCCLRFHTMMMNASEGTMTVCASNMDDYKCNLQIKYIQDAISNNCVNKIMRLLNLVLETNGNIITAFHSIFLV
jgi:hypothetical protein